MESHLNADGAIEPLEEHQTTSVRRSRELKVTFPGCPTPTLGVEVEASLIDLKTMGLAPKAQQVLDLINDPIRAKPELFQTIVELNTEICNTVDDVKQDLTGRIATLNKVAEELGIGCMATGTHPFSRWSETPITPGERYLALLESMRWPVRRLLICGLHVHVGVRSGEHAIAVMNAMSVFLPHLLALSASSPYFEGEETGMASSRIKIFEGMPTAGLPPQVTNWGEFVQLMRTLISSRSIDSIQEIWWDVRPHPGFGTVEIRVCDGVNTMQELVGLVAFVQCMVEHIQDRYDEGESMPRLRHWTLRENKWRASRWGLEAQFIRNERGDHLPLAEHIHEWVERLRPTAKQLKCETELLSVLNIFKNGSCQQRQLAIFKEKGSLENVVEEMVKEFRTNILYPMS